MVAWDADLCNEYEPIEDGSTTSGSPPQRFKLSARALQERKKRHNAFLAVRGPQDTLDPALIDLAMNDTVSDHPLLHYGLMLDRETLEACATRHGLGGEPIPDERVRASFLERAVVDYLQEKCKTLLFLDAPFVKDKDRVVLSLDDTRRLRCVNVKWWDRRMRPVLRILKQELGLKSAKAQWWWSLCYGESYICPIPKYNPSQLRPKKRQPSQASRFAARSS